MKDIKGIRRDAFGEEITRVSPDMPTDIHYPVVGKALKYDTHGTNQFADRRSRRLIVIADPLKDLSSSDD